MRGSRGETTEKLHSECELKPPMHREVSIQVETGFSKQASVNLKNLSMHAKQVQQQSLVDT